MWSFSTPAASGSWFWPPGSVTLACPAPPHSWFPHSSHTSRRACASASWVEGIDKIRQGFDI
eukprot:2587237-Amphidinium_carterae.1